MKPELKLILSKEERRLTSDIDPDHGLFGYLLELEALSEEQVEECKAKATRAKRVEEVLTQLKRGDDDCFSHFCDVLRKIKRADIADSLSQQAADKLGLPAQKDSLAPTVTSNSATTVTELPDGQLPFKDLPPEMIRVIPTAREFYNIHQETAYPMNKSSRGFACIINVYKTLRFSDRDGTNADRQRLQALFQQLQFNVIPYDDIHGLDAQDILKKIKKTAKMTVDITDPPQCYVLFILSHGVMNEHTREEFVLGNDGEKLRKNDILDALAAEENLRETPCLVFFVCCRDYESDGHDAVAVKHDRQFLVAFPCKEASVSWRNSAEGTYYVRCLVKVFMEFAHNTDVATMLEEVKRELRKVKSIQYADAPVSSLKKNLYFFPGITM